MTLGMSNLFTCVLPGWQRLEAMKTPNLQQNGDGKSLR